MTECISPDYNTIFSENNSIYETWRKCNSGHPDLPALEYFGNQWTLKHCEEIIDVYARAFLKLLPDKSKSVTFCTPTLPSTFFAFYALNKIGVRANFVSHTILPSNPKEYIEETDTEILVLFDGFFKTVAASLKKVSLKKIIIVSLSDGIETIPEYVSDKLRPYLQMKNSAGKIKLVMPFKKVLSVSKFTSIGKKETETVKPVYNADETAVVLYTGGSTGVPKGVEMTNEGFISMAKVYTSMSKFDIQVGDRQLILIPPNHPTSFVHTIIIPWFFGAIQVLQPLYNKDSFAFDLFTTKANIVMAAPNHYSALPVCDMSESTLKELKWAYCGGEAVSYEFALSVNKALVRLGARNPYLVIGYGMSEIGPMAIVTQNNPELINKVGKPITDVVARIVDDKGSVLGDNMRGNLEVKSPCRMKGYFKQPELTSIFFTEDGYAKTGDIAVRDENGYYDVIGRATDSIIAVDGSKVYLFDIERIIYKDPAVLEAEVIGLSVNGKDIPVVHIVLNSEHIGKENEVILRVHALCKEHLSVNEMPQGYKIREAFGTNPISAKRDYRALLEERDGYFMVDGDEVRAIGF
ncbi:MAG: acyl--CoA ligase [Oscillospiraceae bacterium]|nr:acyl--CoA ligase [Oscillospiraceae bacterium]